MIGRRSHHDAQAFDDALTTGRAARDEAHRRSGHVSPRDLCEAAAVEPNGPCSETSLRSQLMAEAITVLVADACHTRSSSRPYGRSPVAPPQARAAAGSPPSLPAASPPSESSASSLRAPGRAGRHALRGQAQRRVRRAGRCTVLTPHAVSSSSSRRASASPRPSTCADQGDLERSATPGPPGRLPAARPTAGTADLFTHYEADGETASV